MEANFILALAVAFCSLIVSTFGLGFWINGQFSALRAHIDRKVNEHETDDVTRFNEIGIRLLKLELKLDRDGKEIADYG